MKLILLWLNLKRTLNQRRRKVGVVKRGRQNKVITNRHHFAADGDD